MAFLDDWLAQQRNRLVVFINCSNVSVISMWHRHVHTKHIVSVEPFEPGREIRFRLPLRLR